MNVSSERAPSEIGASPCLPLCANSCPVGSTTTSSSSSNRVTDKPLGRRCPDEGGVNSIISQLFDELVAEALLKRQRHQRESFPKRANDTWQERMKWASRAHADADAALLAARSLSCCFKCVVKVCQYRASLVVECAARICQFNTASLAAKQLHVKFPLHRPDQSAQRRLLHAQSLGRRSDASGFRDRNEIPEVP